MSELWVVAGWVKFEFNALSTGMIFRLFGIAFAKENTSLDEKFNACICIPHSVVEDLLFQGL